VGVQAQPEVWPQHPVKQIAFQVATQRGWADQWGFIDELIQHESSWVVGNINPDGGACGLGQALPCSKLGDGLGNPQAEINWAYGYIADRYGSPAKAWEFWNCTGRCTSKIGTVDKKGLWY
jgi:hypothetical protein